MATEIGLRMYKFLLKSVIWLVFGDKFCLEIKSHLHELQFPSFAGVSKYYKLEPCVILSLLAISSPFCSTLFSRKIYSTYSSGLIGERCVELVLSKQLGKVPPDAILHFWTGEKNLRKHLLCINLGQNWLSKVVRKLS